MNSGSNVHIGADEDKIQDNIGEVNDMSVRQLKDILQRHGLRVDAGMEKKDLVNQVVQLLQKDMINQKTKERQQQIDAYKDSKVTQDMTGTTKLKSCSIRRGQQATNETERTSSGQQLDKLQTDDIESMTVKQLKDFFRDYGSEKKYVERLDALIEKAVQIKEQATSDTAAVKSRVGACQKRAWKTQQRQSDETHESLAQPSCKGSKSDNYEELQRFLHILMCMGFLTFINLEAKEVDDDQELKHDFKSRISLSDFRSEKELYLLEDRQIENILRNHNLWNDGYQDRSEPIRSIIWLWKSKFKGKPGNNSQMSADLCEICHDERISCLLQPCGHVGTCTACSSKVKRCFICDHICTGIKNLYEDHDLKELGDEAQTSSQSNLCLTCKSPVNSVFIPCGHASYCMKCAYNRKECPHCHEYVRKLVRMYKV